MQIDFHYYATYCAAIIAGYSHEDSRDIAYSAQFVDCCSRSFLSGIDAPAHAATTQLQLELMEARTDIIGLQDITRIWAPFHFLPGDLYADPDRKCSRVYKSKYRLICQPNGQLLVDTVELAKGKGVQAIGLAMHVLADTWAHRNFAGTPSLVINNMGKDLSELVPCDEGGSWKPIKCNHNPGDVDDPSIGKYTSSIYVGSENSIMNLGHGRAGHLPDYSYIRYAYLPAWGGYKEIIKDNPHDYECAFAQMVYAMSCLRGEDSDFKKETYAMGIIKPYIDKIRNIITKRQVDASDDWKAFGESLSGESIPDFDKDEHIEEYMSSNNKSDTYLGLFFEAALAQKKMVASKIMQSGNSLAGTQ